MADFSNRPKLSFILAIGAMALLSGCVSADPNIVMTQEAVTSIPVGESTAVSAYDLAAAMVRAGFSRDQILKDGPAVRNALATSGGAQIRDGKFVSALFSVHAGRLYVTSRTRGTFVQDLGMHQPGKFVAAEPPQ
jgi:hypothetical protein